MLLFSCAEKSSDTSENEKTPFDEPEEITSLYDSSLKPFYHGVASGDPKDNAVIIWTRVTPEFEEDVVVKWKMTKDKDLSDIVSEGEVVTNKDIDYTVKTDVKGLDPNTTYYYQFEALGAKSMVGRTKTTGETEELQLAFASCSNYEWGYFNNYKLLALDEDIDAIVHLGDYIYEYAPGGYGDTTIGRKVYPPKEITEKSDYRFRYSQYRTDKDLMAAHQQHPFITIWDDHETANNSYVDGAQNHDSTEGDWNNRKNWATEVYYEWMPVRTDDKLYRSFEWGTLVNLFMLDTRLEGRTVQVDSMTDPHLWDEDRYMIGDEQFGVLFSELQKQHQWKIIGNQVPFGPMINDWKNGVGRYLDGWDGYPIEREKIITSIRDAEIKNIIFMTGDYHSSFAFETDLNATKDTTDNIAVEFVAPSINSANTNEYVNDDTTKMVEAGYLRYNPHLKYVNLRDHGYVKLIISRTQIEAQFLFVETVIEPNTNQVLAKSYIVKSGSAALWEKF